MAVSADGTILTVDMCGQTIWRKVTDDDVQAWTRLPSGKGPSIGAPGSGRSVVVGLDRESRRR